MSKEIKFLSDAGATRTIRIIRRTDFYIYDTNTSTFVATPSSFANTFVDATENTSGDIVINGLYYVNFVPAAGEYEIFVYSGTHLTVLTTDAPIAMFSWVWDGTKQVVITDLLNMLKADWVIDRTTTPWQLVVRKAGTATEIYRKNLKSLTGENIVSADVQIGQQIAPA